MASAKVDLSYDQIEKNFRKARKLAGVEWLRFHDLRHSAASAMINQGVDLYTVGAVLGHRSATSTKRYSHLATERLAEAVFRIGRKVA
ncbi:tyrosine-type recombinase/integrase [Ferrovum myxofaciens]|uniref:tyrosine-type recombinase/integrase n=1 Tax=Ferrovum myxofaciens TaxID=416213 RepID=UPI003B590A72